jgi:hypothetical protein
VWALCLSPCALGGTGKESWLCRVGCDSDGDNPASAAELHQNVTAFLGPGVPASDESCPLIVWG